MAICHGAGAASCGTNDVTRPDPPALSTYPDPVRFQNSATVLTLAFYAARSYSLMRPPRTGRRLIRSWREVGYSVVGPGRMELATAMVGSSVVVGLVLSQGRPQSHWPTTSLRSATSVRAVSTNLSAQAFARGLRGGIFTASIPSSTRTVSNDSVNCPARSRTRNRNSAARSPRSIRRFADLLYAQRAVRVRGDPEMST